MSNNDYDEFVGFDSESGSDNSGGDCSKQISKFEKLTGTKTEEWETAELKSRYKSIDAVGREYYEFSNKDTRDYTDITPFFDDLKENNLKRLEQILSEHEANRNSESKNKAWHSCQYCGHGIIHIFKIKHVKKKLKMTIGSHCVKGFANVDPAIQLLEKRDEDILRKALSRWIKPTIKDAWKNEKFAKRFYRKDGEQKFIPKQNIIDFTEELNCIDIEVISVKEMKDVFRRAETLGFSLPYDINEIIHPRLNKPK